MTQYEQILADRRALDGQGDILILTLHRPDRLNAWTPTMMSELSAAVTGANEDDSVSSIVVTGAGRGFCAGADIGNQFAVNLDAGASGPEPVDPAATGWVKLCRESKPMVAAINGPAIGIGLTMVLPFDQLVAAAGAKLSLRFVKMGLVPELASSHFLTARCGWGAASWLALSGATVLAEEGQAMRLVDRVVSPERVVDEAVAVAAEMGANPSPQLRMIKDLLTRNADETDLDVVQRREGMALEAAYKTREHREAVAAFLEKRAPRFGVAG